MPLKGKSQIQNCENSPHQSRNSQVLARKIETENTGQIFSSRKRQLTQFSRPNPPVRFSSHCRHQFARKRRTALSGSGNVRLMVRRLQ
jgi:hypothetical protein